MLNVFSRHPVRRAARLCCSADTGSLVVVREGSRISSASSKMLHCIRDDEDKTVNARHPGCAATRSVVALIRDRSRQHGWRSRVSAAPLARCTAHGMRIEGRYRPPILRDAASPLLRMRGNKTQNQNLLQKLILTLRSNAKALRHEGRAAARETSFPPFPTKAGCQGRKHRNLSPWIPACAGKSGSMVKQGASTCL